MNRRDVNTAVFLAYKSILRGSRATSALLVFILSLSFLNMLFVSGILFGLQDLMTRTVVDLFSAHVTVSAQQEPRVKQYIPYQQTVRSEIETIPGVVATSRHYLLAGSISFDKEKNGVLKDVSGAILGIDPEEEKKVLGVNRYLIDGEYLAEDDRDQILMSSALAGGYGVFAPTDLGGVRVGDKVRVTYSGGNSRIYKVKGIYDDTIGLFETFITAKEAESVLGAYNEATHVMVRVDLNRTSIDRYESRIKTLFPNLEVKKYTVLLGSFAAFLDALDLIAAIVSMISVLVAAITIFVLVYVNALNKRRQIGILKAIGINQGVIVLSYVLQALFYVACGIAIGSILVFYVLTPLLKAYPIDVDFGYLSLFHKPTTTVTGMISLFVAGLLAGYVPARMIAKRDILKAIWG